MRFEHLSGSGGEPATMDPGPMGLSDIGAVGREYPQFGKSVWNVGKKRDEGCGCGGGCGGSCGSGSGIGCGCSEGGMGAYRTSVGLTSGGGIGYAGQGGGGEFTFNGPGGSMTVQLPEGAITNSGSGQFGPARHPREKFDKITVKRESKCKSTIYMHYYIMIPKGNQCTVKDIESLIKAMEGGAKKFLSGKRCPCNQLDRAFPDGGGRKRKAGQKGCSFSVKIVWHKGKDDRVKGGPEPAPIIVRCGAFAGRGGGGAAHGFSPPGRMELGWPRGEITRSHESLMAHEMGHNLIGRPTRGPFERPIWTDPENPDDHTHNPEEPNRFGQRPLMAPTKWPGKKRSVWGATGREKMTPHEACVIAKAQNACDWDECCPWEEERSEQPLQYAWTGGLH
ncbi:MAG: hypothetical protein KAI24_05650 [Planctomycetes bacterium]|nr:hypothetical protein [Planctomycetota bacterium]